MSLSQLETIAASQPRHLDWIVSYTKRGNQHFGPQTLTVFHPSQSATCPKDSNDHLKR